jgi:hypothetical protein
MFALGPVVLTVNVAGVPGGTELGLIEHAGASAGEGVTVQVSATEPLNPLIAVTSTAAVDDPPGLTVAGVGVEDESVKSRISVANEHFLPRSALYS